MNIWKVITVILILIAIALAYNLYKTETETYNFGVFGIRKAQLNDIIETSELTDFIICDIEKNQCIHIGRLGK